MKKIFLSLLFLSTAFIGCDDGTVYVAKPGNSSGNNTTASSTTNLGANLDLQALGELVKSSKDAADIENKLNTAGSINNIDLDGDGKFTT